MRRGPSVHKDGERGRLTPRTRHAVEKRVSEGRSRGRCEERSLVSVPGIGDWASRQPVLAQIAEAAPFLVCIYDLRGARCEYLNGRVAECLGPRTATEVASGGLWCAAAREDTAQVERHRARLAAAAPGQMLECDFRCHDAAARQRWLHLRDLVFADDAGREPTHVLSLAEDITERKEHTAELLAYEGRLRSLAENAPDLILQIDAAGTIQYLNRAIPPYRVEDALGTSVFDWLAPDDHADFAARLARVYGGGSAEVFEARSPAMQGVCYSCHLGPVVVQGQVASAVLIVRDATIEKQALRRLEDQQRLLRQTLELQERERRLLSCRVHDGLVQWLVAAHMHLQSARNQLGMTAAAVASSLEAAEPLMRHAIADGRHLISVLRPLIIDELGIVPAVEYLAAEHRKLAGPEVRVEHNMPHGRLESLIEEHVFRMIQQALDNVRRHSHARQVTIRLIYRPDLLHVEVQDDGVGFEPERVASEHFGLRSIAERARLCGGWTSIESHPGTGTSVRVDLPLSGH